jgi:hypothetical protein
MSLWLRYYLQAYILRLFIEDKDVKKVSKLPLIAPEMNNGMLDESAFISSMLPAYIFLATIPNRPHQNKRSDYSPPRRIEWMSKCDMKFQKFQLKEIQRYVISLWI